MIRNISGIAILFVAGMLSSAALADNFKFCFEPWEPYGMRDDKGVTSGIVIDFYQQIFTKLGHKLEFVQMPPARCYDQAKTGGVDGFICNSPGTVPEVIDLKFTEEYWMLAAIVPEHSTLTNFTGIEQFKGKTVGVTKEYPYPEELKGFPDMKKEETVDSINSLRKVANNRIDVMFDDPVWADNIAKTEKLKFKRLMPLAASAKDCGSMAKKHAALAEKVNATANELIKAGALDKLYQKYLGMNLKAFKTKYGIKD
jgi:ABC-type amino acid transport substrate-binding protein